MSSNTQSKLRLLIVDDYEWTRIGLRFSLQEKNGLEIIGEAENGEQAVTLSEKLAPDIVLMDLAMPVMDGIIATRAIKEHNPDIKVVILTSHQDEIRVLSSMAAGIDAYCMKDISVELLVQTLEMVRAGVFLVDPAVKTFVSKSITSCDANTGKIVDIKRLQRMDSTLTQRESEVLQLLSQGKSNKEIAKELKISCHTIKIYVGNIIDKLNVVDRTEAAIKALKQGLV